MERRLSAYSATPSNEYNEVSSCSSAVVFCFNLFYFDVFFSVEIAEYSDNKLFIGSCVVMSQLPLYIGGLSKLEMGGDCARLDCLCHFAH